MHVSWIDPRELALVERDLGRGRRELVLHGRLPLGWCEKLSTHFAARDASIDRMIATSDVDRLWDVEIALRGGRGVDVRRGLVEHEPIDVRLYELRMESGRAWSEDDGSVGLEVHGRDRRGLLAALLRHFAMHGLFPVQMDIQTRGEHVHDRFVMRGFSGCAPSAGAADRLLSELLHAERKLAAR